MKTLLCFYFSAVAVLFSLAGSSRSVASAFVIAPHKRPHLAARTPLPDANVSRRKRRGAGCPLDDNTTTLTVLQASRKDEDDDLPVETSISLRFDSAE